MLADIDIQTQKNWPRKYNIFLHEYREKPNNKFVNPKSICILPGL